MALWAEGLNMKSDAHFGIDIGDVVSYEIETITLKGIVRSLSFEVMMLNHVVKNIPVVYIEDILGSGDFLHRKMAEEVKIVKKYSDIGQSSNPNIAFKRSRK